MKGTPRELPPPTVDVRSPFDGHLVGAAPIYGREAADTAVARAARCLSDPLPAWHRAELIERAVAALRNRREDFARLIMSEVAKPITAALEEVTRAAETLVFSAIVARTLGGDLLAADGSASGEGKVAWVRRVPIGVVLGITPFNFPLNLLCHKVRPALAVGCPIIVKPAPASPLTALCFAELLEELGLPLGWVQVIPCENEVVEALVHHRDVAMVTFTGSPNVGWSIRSNVPRKRVSLEVGNNAPVIIEPDADCETVARKIGVAGYSFAGQSCVSTQRVLVHASLASEFLDALTSEVSRLGVGDPNEAGTVVSSLITTAATERVRGWIREAVGEGARLVVGGVCETRC